MAVAWDEEEEEEEEEGEEAHRECGSTGMEAVGISSNRILDHCAIIAATVSSEIAAQQQLPFRRGCAGHDCTDAVAHCASTRIQKRGGGGLRVLVAFIASHGAWRVHGDGLEIHWGLPAQVQILLATSAAAFHFLSSLFSTPTPPTRKPPTPLLSAPTVMAELGQCSACMLQAQGRPGFCTNDSTTDLRFRFRIRAVSILYRFKSCSRRISCRFTHLSLRLSPPTSVHTSSARLSLLAFRLGWILVVGHFAPLSLSSLSLQIIIANSSNSATFCSVLCHSSGLRGTTIVQSVLAARLVSVEVCLAYLASTTSPSSSPTLCTQCTPSTTKSHYFLLTKSKLHDVWDCGCVLAC
ncbi:unnamed protein product [Hydatigera taeniaeformis]|uniref:C3H1-type domain-containing protein n=1 Tax=Hydatigena taeniaeformis TaxID=6205 RepID=A0A0R3WPX7_HYDTA|nr:unnamed protein product [Hydatigera taeniaeformis]